MKLVGIALGLIILLSFGCNRSASNEASEPQLEAAYQLIDDGYYTQAIDMFWALLQAEDNATIRIGLASAYAARAGVLVQNYWDLILPLIKVQPKPVIENLDNIKKDLNHLILKFPPDVQKILIINEEKILKSYENLEILKIHFQKIPLLNGYDQVGDINMSRTIIKDVPTKGAHLYRALLSLVLIRFEINQSFYQFHQFIDTLKNSDSNQVLNPCSTQLKLWVENLEPISSILSDLILDLKYSYPNKTSEIEPFEKEFQKYSEIIRNLNSLIKIQVCH